MAEKVEEDVNGVKNENESEDMGTETEESDTESDREEELEEEKGGEEKGEKKEKEEKEEQEVQDEQDEQDDQEEQEEGVLQAQTQSQSDDLVYDDLELLPSSNTISKEDLEDDDMELWLVRIPGHDTLIESVVGSNVTVSGSYYFRDHGSAGLENMRAFSVVKDDDGEASLYPAKPFARSVTVTFDCMLTNMNTTPQEDRTYPEKPSGLKLQYVAVGSKRGHSNWLCRRRYFHEYGQSKANSTLFSLPEIPSQLPTQNVETPLEAHPLVPSPREKKRKRRSIEIPGL